MALPGKARRALAALLAPALLAGCAGALGGSVESLLRAPQLSGQASAVQRALNAYLGVSVNFKYPASGEFLSPFLFEDWDGDGVQEAAALYTTGDAANVFLALLEPEGEGGWRVTQTAEGLSGEVDSVAVAHLRDADSLQLLVGYGSAQGDRYLVVYLYAEQTLQTVISQSYTHMLLTNVTGSGDTEDLVLALPSEGENAGVNLHLLTNAEAGFQSTQTRRIGEGQFTDCAALHAGAGPDGRPYLVVDGWSGATAGSLFSAFVAYNSETGFLNTFLPEGLEDPYSATLRYDAALTSRDLDGDGDIDIPVEIADGGELQEPLGHGLRFLNWQDFVGPRGGTQTFGVYDGENCLFLALPRLMRGRVALRANAAGNGWQVRDARTGALYCELRVVDPAATPANESYRRIANIGSQQLQARVVSSYPGLTLDTIAGRVTLLQS